MSKHPGTPSQLIARRRWIDALRSGKYTQGRNRLKNNDNSFCCLGVACDISGLGEWKFIDLDTSPGFVSGDEELTATPPSSVWEQLGLPRQYESRIWHMNDGIGLSFAQIADFLEEQLEVAPAT